MDTKPDCCSAWTENIDKVNAPFLHAKARNPDAPVDYQGTPFAYCPWCGAGLTSPAVDPVSDIQDILTALSLGTQARPESTHTVVQREILPAIAALRTRAADPDDPRVQAFRDGVAWAVEIEGSPNPEYLNAEIARRYNSPSPSPDAEEGKKQRTWSPPDYVDDVVTVALGVREGTILSKRTDEFSNKCIRTVLWQLDHMAELEQQIRVTTLDRDGNKKENSHLRNEITKADLRVMDLENDLAAHKAPDVPASVPALPEPVADHRAMRELLESRIQSLEGQVKELKAWNTPTSDEQERRSWLEREHAELTVKLAAAEADSKRLQQLFDHGYLWIQDARPGFHPCATLDELRAKIDIVVGMYFTTRSREGQHNA